jgi:hypothetical protein
MYNSKEKKKIQNNRIIITKKLLYNDKSFSFTLNKLLFVLTFSYEECTI